MVKSISWSEKLLLSPHTKVTCPECEHEFSLEDGFAKKALETVEKASAAALAQLRESERDAVEKRAEELANQHDLASKQELARAKKLLNDQAAAHEKALADVQAIVTKSFKPQIDALQREIAARDGRLKSFAEREAKLTERERTLESRVSEAAQLKATELVATAKRGFESQLNSALAEVSTLRSKEVELRREKGVLAEKAASLEVESARKLDAERAEIAEKARRQEQERAAFEKAELHKKLDDVNAKLADAQRKIEQGSQQLQGEVLELAIEENLRRAFPLDTIEEVKKGQRGGDVLQHVTTRMGQTAGTILWESKRAKDWSLQWIPKLKEDMRECGAAVGILVTMPGAVPREWDDAAYFALHEEVWVTQPACVIGIAEALRAGLIDLHRQRAVSAGKGEKMEALYDYLTSPQFAQKLKAVYDTFKRMREELESEKNVTTQRWARREKQLQAGMTQLLGIGGEIQGIADEELPMLEMEPQRDMSL
jgi:hypothetical protein